MATLKERAAQKLRELREKALDKETQRKVKEEIQKRFTETKDLLKKLETELRKPENRQKAEEKIKLAKAKLAKLKAEFLKRQTQAKAYTENNPEKALAVAAAAGALVGAFWVAVRRKK
jgi:ElaB/YqjD/DUF883 family membrane-anchored ribosome-binding protein